MKLEDIKTGDFLFYSERYYGSDYADSLIKITNVDGVDMAHPICTNWMGEYINETPENWGEDLPVSASFEEHCWFPTDYKEGDPSEWMSKNHPLDNEVIAEGEFKTK